MTLVRHGRTQYNAEHRFKVRLIASDEIGRWLRALQKICVLSTLISQPERKQLVVGSTSGRAQETVHAFADTLGLMCIDERVVSAILASLSGMPVSR